VVLASVGTDGTDGPQSKQSNLQSDRDSLIDLDCEIKGWSIRIELTISVSEDRINNQPETVSTNNKLFSSIDKKEPHLMF
jgi:hypothetical protein